MIQGFKQISAEECWREYRWGCEAREGTNIDYGAFGIFIDVLNEHYDECGKPMYACEIYTDDGDMVGMGFGSTSKDALLDAWCDAAKEVAYDSYETE